jgi:MYXO-CTERM domain-containing protein
MITAGAAQSIALTASGLPTGATATFTPASITAGGNAMLTIATAATTAPGSYTVTVTGTGAAATHTATVSLTVLEAAADDFSVAANPANITAKQGTAAPTSIETTTVSGNPQSLALSVTGLPSGATATFTADTINSGENTTLNVVAGAATLVGTYPLTVTATGASGTHTATVSLQVTAGAKSGGGCGCTIGERAGGSSGNVAGGLAFVMLGVGFVGLRRRRSARAR